MVSAPQNIIPVMLRDALCAFWREADRLENYFWTHFLFEALYNQHPGFQAAWDARALESSQVAHTLQGCLSQPYDAENLGRILAATPIQKLTYKIPEQPPGSYWHHICEQK